MKIEPLVLTQGNTAGMRTHRTTHDDGSPDPYPTMWVGANMRHRTGTRKTMLSSIIPLKLWAQFRGCDFEREMVWGDCLSHEQIVDFKSFIGLDVKDLKALLVAPPLDLNKWLRSPSRNFVGLSTLDIRRTYTSDYLLFLGAYGNRCMRKMGYKDPRSMAIRKKRLAAPRYKRRRGKTIYPAGSISEQLASGVSKRKPRYKNNSARVASAEAFALAFAAADVREIWPHKTDKSQKSDEALRNELLTKMLLQTGGRVGELQGVKTGDIEPARRGYLSVHIVDRPDDPEDPRAHPPSVKTRERTIRINEETSELLYEWLEVHDEVTDGLPHTFLFVNLLNNAKRGAPITHVPILNMLAELCDHLGVARITPHDLRHFNVTQLAREGRKKGLTEEEWRKVSTYLFGWSSGSKMPLLYSSGDAETLANEIMLEVWNEAGFGIDWEDKEP